MGKDGSRTAATRGVLGGVLAMLDRGTTHVGVATDHLILDEAGVIQKYGVAPESIPDWLALVGDSADGFPGISGWGKATASSVLGRYGHLEDIPVDGLQWDVRVRGQVALARTLVENL